MLVVFNSLKVYLDVFGGCGPAFSGEISDGLAEVYLGDSANGEHPEDLLTDHDLDPALVHLTGVGDKRKGDLQDAEGFYLKLWFCCVEQAEHLLI